MVGQLTWAQGEVEPSIFKPRGRGGSSGRSQALALGQEDTGGSYCFPNRD